MKNIMFIVTFLYASILHAMEDADTILKRVRDRFDGNDYVSNVTLTTKKDNIVLGKKIMYMLQKDVGDIELTLLSVQYPADMRNIGFLIKTYKEASGKEDDQWMYLPAFRKVRRISSKDKRGAFMGSEISYFDLDKLRIRDFDSKVLKEEMLDGHDSWVIERSPVSQDVINKVGYQRVLVWVDKETDLLLRQEYYDAKDILVKRQKTKAIKKIQDIWTITESIMKNYVDNRVTILTYENTQYNLGLDKKLFSKRRLKQGVTHADVPQLLQITTE